MLFRSGDERHLGKPVGSDLRQGIATLPVYHYLQGGGRVDLVEAALEREPADRSARERAIAELVASVVSSEAITACRQEAERLARQAAEDVAVVAAGPYRQALHDLAAFVVTRDL